MKYFTSLLAIAVVCGGLAAAQPARADDNDDSAHWWHRHHDDKASDRAERRIGDADRVVLHDYIVHDNYCGLHDCTTVTTYTAGSILPGTVVYAPLPGEVVTRLGPAPEGTAYVSSNGRVYLIDPGTREVIDTVIP
jgi:hypothetical protein